MLLTEVTESEKLGLLKYAIENKYVITIYYNGVSLRDINNKSYTRKGWRMIEPVSLGKSKGSLKNMLRAWQLNGTSNGDTPAWKTFLVDEIAGINVLDGSNGTDYKTFMRPSGANFQTGHDFKMKGDRPDIIIDLNKEPGPNKGQAPSPPQPQQQNNDNQLNENTFLGWIKYVIKNG
jgi:hypothetical protein